MWFQGRQHFNDFTCLGITHAEVETGAGSHSGGIVFKKEMLWDETWRENCLWWIKAWVRTLISAQEMLIWTINIGTIWTALSEINSFLRYKITILGRTVCTWETKYLIWGFKCLRVGNSNWKQKEKVTKNLKKNEIHTKVALHRLRSEGKPTTK